MRFKNNKKIKAFSSVEVMLAVSLFSLLAVTVTGSLLYSLESIAFADSRLKASLLAEEGLEIARNIRDNDFADLNEGSYGLNLNSSGEWEFQNVSDVSDGYTRTIDIVNIDENTYQIDSTVTWPTSFSGRNSISFTSYFKNIYEPILIQNNPWTSPLILASFDVQANNAGIDVDVSNNNVFITRQNGNQGLTSVNISNLPSIIQNGSSTINGGAFNTVLNGDFAYIATNSNNREIQIFNINNTASISNATNINQSGNGDALSIDYWSNKIITGRASNNSQEINIYDVAIPATPLPLGALEISNANINDIKIQGNFAYLATSANNGEIIVLNISNPSLPVEISRIDLASDSDALTIDVEGNNAYIGKQNGTIEVVDITNPASLNSIGGITLTGVVEDLDFYDGYVFAAFSGAGTNNGFRVINATNPASLNSISTLKSDTNEYFGITYDLARDLVYLVSNNNSAEFVIYESN